MLQGHYVFSQLMEHVPLTTLRRCVARYGGDHKIKNFSLPRPIPLSCVPRN